MKFNPLKHIAVVGGVHGNEFTGIYLIKKFEQFPHLVQRPSFRSTILLANPEAFAAGRRYLDKDLNRCFLRQDLEDKSLGTHEEIRAKVIYQILKSEDNYPVDFIIDIHSTTANMGLTIIPSSPHPFNLQLATYLSSKNSLVKVYRWIETEQSIPFLRAICELGCTIEVGPIAQGILEANLFQQTEKLIYTILDYLEAYNQEILLPSERFLNLYQCVKIIDYPRSVQGEIQAMIHPTLQFKDYQVLNPGDPLFLGFDGQVIVYQEELTVYPAFINEAAYYEKGIAMCLTEKQQMTV